MVIGEIKVALIIQDSYCTEKIVKNNSRPRKHREFQNFGKTLGKHREFENLLRASQNQEN